MSGMESLGLVWMLIPLGSMECLVSKDHSLAPAPARHLTCRPSLIGGAESVEVCRGPIEDSHGPWGGSSPKAEDDMLCFDRVVIHAMEVVGSAIQSHSE